jgi:Flp pilus assembly protein TadD
LRSSRTSSRAEAGFGWQLAAIVVLATLPLVPVLRNDFVVYDDALYVTDNPRVLAGVTAEGLGWAWTTLRAGNWHPLAWLSHMLDVQIWGARPLGHHLTSLLLHIANAALLLVLLRSATGAPWPSTIAAGLFAVHPLHVEVVAWVAERKELLSAFFGLLATAAYVRWTRHAPWHRSYLPALLLHAAALCSKPMLVTLPFLWLLLDSWPLRRGPAAALPRRVLEKLPFFALSLASSLVTLLAQARGGALWSLEELPLAVRALHVPLAYVAYLGKTLWPVGLSVLYPHAAVAPAPWRAAAALVLLAAITLFVVRARHQRPHLLVGWLWFVGSLVPVIGLVQVGAQAIADRYTYIPLIGLFIGAAWELAPRLRARGPRVLLAVVLVALSVISFRQASRWKDSETLLTHAIAVTPENTIAALMLGSALAEQGRFEEALDWMRRAVAMRPGAAWPRRVLGSALLAAGRPGDAAGELHRAIELEPRYAEARNDLGRVLWELGRPQDAIAELQLAIELRPGYADALANLGGMLLVQGEEAAGLGRLEEALHVDPDHADAGSKLGLALAQRGDLDAAERRLSHVVQLQPGHVVARGHLALVYYLRGEHERARRQLALVREAGGDPDPRLVQLLGEGGR